VIPAFSAQAESGQNYPALANVWTPQGLSGMTLLPGGMSTGKVYFDAVGDPPTSVVYNGAGDMVAWVESSSASEEEVAPESESPDSASVDSEGNGDVVTAEEEG
jgi:Domain of unknown function (DUF1942)